MEDGIKKTKIVECMDIGFYYILILILTGVGVGFTTGLLGIGGGFILVPILFFLLLGIGVDSTLAIRIAFGTSLAIILPTAISSAYGHYRKNQVEIKPAIYFGISGFLGGITGGYVATHTPEDILRIIFGFIMLSVALRLLFFKESTDHREKMENILLFLVVGFVAGIMSGLIGVGGGIILIPIMVLIMGYSMKEASGTSSAVIIVTSLGGIISYILNGLQISGLPPYSLGYINLLQLLVIMIFSVPLAQVGAWASSKLPENVLRYILVTLQIYISLKMLGVFE
ncbi:MAG TPA: sulfite exporter TauE/SafE family protein, partial [Methanobacterium sp.]